MIEKLVDLGKLLEQVIHLADEAARAVMVIYRDDSFQVNHKSDDSPVTCADLAAHKIICEGLARLTPQWPILSEESLSIPWAERSHWSRYWLVDPLDGTREFVAGNDGFAVNIALIDQGSPLLGVIAEPVAGLIYAACKCAGADSPGRAFRQSAEGTREVIRACKLEPGGLVQVAVSRHYGLKEVEPILADLKAHFADISVSKVGSSLKFCRVAEGSVDIYPRFAPTSEWDTAAGQAIIEVAGGGVYDLAGLPLRYNQKECLLNPAFYAVGDPAGPWCDLFAP